MLLLTGHGVWRLSQRTKLSMEELRIILDEHAYIDLENEDGRPTSYLLFFDGRLGEYMVGCVRDDTLVTVMPHLYDLPSVIRRQMTDRKYRRAKNLFYDVAAPKFLVPCLAMLDVRVTIRNRTKCIVEALSVGQINRTGYTMLGVSEVCELFASEIFDVFRTKNEKGVLAYRTIIEVLLYDQNDCLVTRFQTTVRKFLNRYVTDDVALRADLRVSYQDDVTMLPLGVVPYSVVRENTCVWHHLAESVEQVIEKCEIGIPYHILRAVKYRVQIQYEGIMLSDWQTTMSDYQTLCRILNYHPQ